MAVARGRNDPPLSERLFAGGHEFDFFQAVRVLQALAREQSPSENVGPCSPVGYDFNPVQEAVRFRVTPSHRFPAGSVCEVRSFDAADEPRPPEIDIAFFGMTGPMGVMPHHYTTTLIARIREKDFALRDFLDLFHHRQLSLFFRAWQKDRFAFAYEQETSAGNAEDLFTACLYCLVGLGAEKLRGRMDFDDEVFLYYSGHLAHWPRSASGLSDMLNDYFELPVAVQQLWGQWLYLSREDQSALPTRGSLGKPHNELGNDVVVGKRVWNVESKFRLVIGPLNYAQFRRLMPDGDMLRPACQMTRFYVGPHLDFDVQLVLKAKEVPWCRLGGDGSAPSRLGWNTWIRSQEFRRDVSDPVFSLEV
jgi:type VI secretion system protein ImpH